MKKVCKAINEGLHHKLIDFGDNKILKSERITRDLYKFELGDFVYKDQDFKYNNTYGEKVAICVNDDPDNMMYMVLDHQLSYTELPWAESRGILYRRVIDTTYENGKYNTNYIKNNFKNCIDGTIWSYLKPNEYIPAIDELKIIYDNIHIIEKIIGKDVIPNGSWSSSLCLDSEPHRKYAWCYDYNEEDYVEEKPLDNLTIVLLNIENE